MARIALKSFAAGFGLKARASHNLAKVTRMNVLSNLFQRALNPAVLLLLISLVSVSSAQDKAVLSFIDLDPTPPELFDDCVSSAPDALGILECTTSVEIVDVTKQADCVNSGAAQCERYAFNVPMYPQKLGLTVEKVYKELWDRYVDDVNEYAKDKMKEAGCWVASYPTTVLSQVIMYAHTEAAVRYWKEVFIASLYYMPASLWWRSPFPGDGGVLVPSYSLVPRPQDYIDMAGAATDAGEDWLYYFQPPAFPSSAIGFEEDDLVEGWPGLQTQEQLKEAFFNSKLTIPTALEYNQFGHTSFFRAYGRRSMKVFTVFEPSCIPPPLGKSPVGIFPVPFIPRADTEWLSVAEGYPFDDDMIDGDYWIPLPQAAYEPLQDAGDGEALLGSVGGDLLSLLPLGGGVAGITGGLGGFDNFGNLVDDTLNGYFDELGDGFDDMKDQFDLSQADADNLSNAGNLTDLDGLDAAGENAQEGADSNEPDFLISNLDYNLVQTLPKLLAENVVNELPGGDFEGLGFFEKVRTIAAFSNATEDYVEDQTSVTDSEGNVNTDASRLDTIAFESGGLESFIGGSSSGSAFGTQDFSYGGGGGFGGLAGGTGPDDRDDLAEVLNCPTLSVSPKERFPNPLLKTASGGVVRTPHYNDVIRYLFSGYTLADGYTQDMNQNLQGYKNALGLPTETINTDGWVPSYTILCDGDEGGEVRRLNAMLGSGGNDYDEQEVIDFQAENGLEPDGMTGPETWLALSANSTSVSLLTAPLTLSPSNNQRMTNALNNVSNFRLLLILDPPPGAAPQGDPNTSGEAASPEAEDVSYRKADEWPGTIRNWFGPDGPLRLDDPEGEDSCQRYSVENPSSPLDYEAPQSVYELAQWVLYRESIGKLSLATENPPNPDTGLLNEPDESDPLSNINAALAGQPAKRSSGLASFGGETYLSPDMLEGLLAISDHYNVRVSAVAGGDHSPGAAHYGGGAFQIDMINGENVLDIAERVETDTSVDIINQTYQEGDELKNTCAWGSAENPIVQVLALCGAADAKATAGPTSDTVGRRDHIMCAWPTKADVE